MHGVVLNWIVSKSWKRGARLQQAEDATLRQPRQVERRKPPYADRQESITATPNSASSGATTGRPGMLVPQISTASGAPSLTQPRTASSSTAGATLSDRGELDRQSCGCVVTIKRRSATARSADMFVSHYRV
jgi:hypothetical protein